MQIIGAKNLDPVNIQISKPLSINKQAAWEVLADYGNIHLYHPALKDTKLLSSLKHGKGAKRHCIFNDGGEVDTWRTKMKITFLAFPILCTLASSVHRAVNINAWDKPCEFTILPLSSIPMAFTSLINEQKILFDLQ